MKNPYGLKNGVLVTVDSVESGLACGCVCPACSEPLEAHKGKVKNHYFKHYNDSDCGYGLETAAHLYAKSVIEKRRVLLLPSLKATPNWEQLRYLENQYLDSRPFSHKVMFKVLVPPFYKLQVDSVLVEKRLGSIVPDLIVVARGRELLVEIKITHGVNKEKEQYVKQNKLSMVEYDFEKMRLTQNFNHIESVLTSSYKGAKRGKGYARWVNHLRLEEAVREVTENMRKHYPDTQK